MPLIAQGAASSSGRPAENGTAAFRNSPAPQQSGSAQSEFARRASSIGVGIHNTSQKLHKLAQLAKRTSMFDDPAVEINQMTNLIKQDIQALNSSIAELQNFSVGGRSDANKQSSDISFGSKRFSAPFK